MVATLLTIGIEKIWYFRERETNEENELISSHILIYVLQRRLLYMLRVELITTNINNQRLFMDIRLLVLKN